MKTEKSYVGLSKDGTKVYAILKSKDGYSEVIDVVTEGDLKFV